MCVQDALDMYGAWRVITAVQPALPAAPALREQWLLMLAHGALDARDHADQFRNALALLWGALRHADARVRAAAATAAAQYPLDLLEELEALQPLGELCEVRTSLRLSRFFRPTAHAVQTITPRLDINMLSPTFMLLLPTLPLSLYCSDNGIACSKCANDPQEMV